MTKFPLFIKTAQNIKCPQIPPIMPLVPYEEAVGYGAISRNRQARRLLQQRRDLEAPYKAVA